MDLKIKDVAELLNVSETTVRQWLVDKRIPAYRINEQYRFSRTEIEDWVLRHKLENSQDLLASEKSLSPSPSELSSPVQGGNKQYSLYRAVHKGGILYDIPETTKEDVIKSATKTIATNLGLDAEILSELLLERENLQSTGLGHGIGLPHTRDYLLNTHQDIVVIVFPKKPLPYNSIDGKPVHTLFFLFACDDKRHLHLLAKIAHLSSLPETINLLQSKPKKEVLLEYIKNWEGCIQKVQEEIIGCN
jgi:nitrogen PTS system EIIA component